MDQLTLYFKTQKHDYTTVLSVRGLTHAKNICNAIGERQLKLAVVHFADARTPVYIVKE